MANELAQQVPEYLKRYTSGDGEFKDDMGDMTPQDYGVNMVKLCSSSSPEAKPNWGGNDESPMEQGTMFLSITREIVPVDKLFIPLLRRISFVYWIGKPGDGQMRFRCTDRNDPRIVECNGLTFQDDPNDPGKRLPPLVTEYVNFYVMIQGIDEPVLLPFKRTSMPIGRKLTQQINRMKKNPAIPPLVCMFKFLKPTWEKAGSNIWPQFNIAGAGFTPEKYLAKAEKMRNLANLIAQEDERTGRNLAAVEKQPENVVEGQIVEEKGTSTENIPTERLAKAETNPPPKQQPQALTVPSVPGETVVTPPPQESEGDLF